MNTHDILKKVVGFEIEATTRCNAGCPGCPRYDYDELDKLNSFVKIEDITIDDFKHIFHSPEYMNNKSFHFCGLLGDCLSNRDIFDIFSYITLTSGNVNLQLSTNGSVRSTDWWNNLGELSALHQKKHRRDFTVCFAVDGHKETNHLYRRHTKFDKILENMYTYKEAGGIGRWVYIVFDHNEHEIDIAKKEANKLGFRFDLKLSYRNEANKNDGMKKSKLYSSTKAVENFKELFSNRTLSTQVNFQNDITCRWTDENKLFIGANKTLWPCCFLYNADLVHESDSENLRHTYGAFNDLMAHDLADVLQHEWFSNTLKDSFNTGHSLNHNRCERHCSKGKQDIVIHEDDS